MVKILYNKILSIISRVEKIVKVDLIYYLKGSFWMNMEQGVSTLTAIILSIVFANLLSKETYGSYSYILTIANLLAFTTLTSMNEAVTRSVAKGNNDSVISALYTKIRFGFFGSIISLAIALYYFINNSLVLAICFLFVSLFIPFWPSLSIYSAFFNGKRNFGLSSIIGAARNIITSFFLVMVIFFTRNIFLIILTYFLSFLLFDFFYLKKVINKFKLTNIRNPETISYGKYLSFVRIIGLINSNIDKILIWNLLGPVQVAVYSIALAPVDKIKGTIGNIKSLAFPKFSLAPQNQMQKTLMGKMLKLFFILIPVVATYIIFIPFLFKIFYPKYLDSIIYSQILSLTILATPEQLFTVYFKAHKMKKEIVIMSSVVPLINILIMVFAGVFFGLIGLVIGRVLGFISYFPVAFYLFKFQKYKD